MAEESARWFRRHKQRLEAAAKFVPAIRTWCQGRKVGLTLKGGPHVHDYSLIFRHQFGRKHAVAVWKPALGEVWRAYGDKLRPEYAHLHSWWEVQWFLEDWLRKMAGQKPPRHTGYRLKDFAR